MQPIAQHKPKLTTQSRAFIGYIDVNPMMMMMFQGPPALNCNDLLCPDGEIGDKIKQGTQKLQ